MPTTPTFTPVQIAANKFLSQLISFQSNTLRQASQLNDQLTTGIPAVGSTPAISAADLQAELGTKVATAETFLNAILVIDPPLTVTTNS
jgi:hypothetical protein